MKSLFIIDVRKERTSGGVYAFCRNGGRIEHGDALHPIAAETARGNND
jgi:hypothetical protein